MDCARGRLLAEMNKNDETVVWWTDLGQLALCLPRPSHGMMVAAVELTRDVAGDAHARGGGAGVGHGAGDVRGAVVDGRDGGRTAERGPAAGIVAVTDREVLNEARERHGC